MRRLSTPNNIPPSIVSSIADIFGLSSFDECEYCFVQRHRTIMQIRTPLDLGLVIRDRRRKLKLSQTELARKAGVGRQWVVAIEHGKSRAELGLVLRYPFRPGSPVDDRPRRSPAAVERRHIAWSDIDAIVNAAKEDRP